MNSAPSGQELAPSTGAELIARVRARMAESRRRREDEEAFATERAAFQRAEEDRQRREFIASLPELSCKHCRFFHPAVTWSGRAGDGECRRDPPTLPQSYGYVAAWGVWPIVSLEYWCGAHEPT
jgi:hypothetical protein